MIKSQSRRIPVCYCDNRNEYVTGWKLRLLECSILPKHLSKHKRISNLISKSNPYVTSMSLWTHTKHIYFHRIPVSYSIQLILRTI